MGTRARSVPRRPSGPEREDKERGIQQKPKNPFKFMMPKEIRPPQNLTQASNTG